MILVCGYQYEDMKRGDHIPPFFYVMGLRQNKSGVPAEGTGL